MNNINGRKLLETIQSGLIRNKIQTNQDVIHHDECSNQNWMVMCIDGKKEYIRFSDMSQKNIKDMHKFLNKFKV